MIQIDDLAIDAQLDELFYSMVQNYSDVYAGETAKNVLDEIEDEYVSSLALVPIGLNRFTLARETFAVIGWTLIICSDLEQGCFFSPFLRAVHCMEEGGAVCSLESDPRSYFLDEKCTALNPAIVKDIDTSLICCCENHMNPIKFAMDALKEHPNLEEDSAGCCEWDVIYSRMSMFAREFNGDGDKVCTMLEELLDVQDLFLEQNAIVGA